MNLTRRRYLMINNDDGNLFRIRDVKICGYNAVDLTTYAPKVDGNVIWNGGVTGSANGGYVYISTDGINKISFYADVQVTDTTSPTWKNGLAIYGFNDINSKNLMTDRKMLYNTTIAPTDSSVSFTANVSGYKYAGFAFGAQSRYIIGLSNIKILEVVE